MAALPVFLWAGCSNENQILPPPAPNDTLSTGKLSAKEAFPNQIGDSWTYSAYDSSSQTAKTIVQRIIGDTIFKNGEKFTIRVYQYPFNSYRGIVNLYAKTLDTEYVNINGDTVNLNTKYGFYDRKYLFPLFPGKSWRIDHLSKIEKVETITVPAGTFDSCYDIRTVISSFNYGLIIDDWFKPKVGIVQKYIYEMNFAPPDIQLWKLENYKLAK